MGGQQYADVCRILLALHNPRTPTTGLDRLTAWRDIDKLVTKLLRRICGIALSNRRFLAAMSTAGMAIVICMQARFDFDQEVADKSQVAIVLRDAVIRRQLWRFSSITRRWCSGLHFARNIDYESCGIFDDNQTNQLVSMRLPTNIVLPTGSHEAVLSQKVCTGRQPIPTRRKGPLHGGLSRDRKVTVYWHEREIFASTLQASSRRQWGTINLCI